MVYRENSRRAMCLFYLAQEIYFHSCDTQRKYCKPMSQLESL